MQSSSCDQRHHAWPLFLRTYSILVEMLDAELQQERGLPLTWFDVLAHLAGTSGGKMRMNDLSESVLLSKSGVTRLVDRMERAGLIARGACASDRRVVYAVITPQGRTAFRKAAPIAFRGVEEHFSRLLEPAEEKVFTSVLERLLDAAQAASVRRPVKRAG
ncbi:MAG: MarR family winged helix-turn-helix transcriptional regulator [Actinomycetota bacterium]